MLKRRADSGDVAAMTDLGLDLLEGIQDRRAGLWYDEIPQRRWSGCGWLQIVVTPPLL